MGWGIGKVGWLRVGILAWMMGKVTFCTLWNGWLGYRKPVVAMLLLIVVLGQLPCRDVYE